MTRAEETDERLMAAYVAGDEAAFQAIFERYSPVLFAMLRRHVRAAEEARDLLQQTFLHLHRARADFRPESNLRPWLFTIAMNCVREHHRRRGRRPETPLEGAHEARLIADSPSLEALEEGLIRRDRLREALASLPDNQREVIELHWFQDRPFEEVARTVGASLSAVKVRAHRGYTRLRALLAELDPGSRKPE